MQNGDYSARSDTLRNNERAKHFAGVMTAWGNALVIAAFASISLRGGLELYSLGWLVVAALLLWLSSNILKLLDAEENDG